MKTVKLATLCNVLSGFAFKSELFGDKGIPVVRIRDVVRGTSNTYYSGEFDEKYILENGDILVGMDGDFNTAYWRGGKALLNQRVCKIEVDPSKVCKKFIYYLLPLKLKKIWDDTPFVTVKHLSVKKLLDIDVPDWPLETQQQIAEVLEKADKLRKDCQKMEQELNSLAQSVFIDMFGDPLTNPKGWEVRKLKEFYISEKDGTKCGPFGSALKKEEFVESGVPVWNMDNITLNGTFRDGASLWITKQKYEELDKYSVNQGDVIISRAGTVGKMGVVKSIYEQSIISTNLIRVRFGDKLDPLYFVCLMTYFKTRLKRLKVGDDGSFSHMNTGILDQLEFPYPPVEEQQKYIKFRSKLDDEIERLTSLKNEYECNFNSLMQKAFKGELKL
ncbi:EcoKI restriction-modification system protein HsdS [Vibrio thalassae]|uniref:EcoKI restriction-modification system protein HsdS n=1 Tax=Vibrio thalassae TaxID=1243014 RepID=A0A240EHT0_9VIBR|nr:restriction endonuclease subunit S [Vibrio thalassae]SNX48106.1 EcoKI restriction-modification system protein HsdS [Vibrio thalassae]